MIPSPGCPLWLPDLPGPAGASAMPAVSYTTPWGRIQRRLARNEIYRGTGISSAILTWLAISNRCRGTTLALSRWILPILSSAMLICSDQWNKWAHAPFISEKGVGDTSKYFCLSGHVWPAGFQRPLAFLLLCGVFALAVASQQSALA